MHTETHQLTRSELKIQLQMRIRTDNKDYREDVIEQIADYYNCNKTDAMIWAATDIPQVHQAIVQVLDRDDLTVKQKREICETLNDNIRGTEFHVDHSVTVDKPGD